MTKKLLQTAASSETVETDGDAAIGSTPVENIDTPATDRPEGVPEKFWDAERNEVRTEAMIKSYGSLERKLGSLAGSVEFGAPDSPDGYQIETSDPMVASDPEVNARLHEAGFSQSQAQLVYELASERVAPLVTEMAAEFAMQRQVDQLTTHFGGKDAWRETASQIASWGKANLPDETFMALASTHEGVIALHGMMAKGEPGISREGQASQTALSEASLKTMMRDPRYWRDHDPSFVEQVKNGFEQLYKKTG